MPTPTKYRKKYTKQLLEGLRADGKSIEECCQIWGVNTKTYNNWIEKYPEFKEAAEFGERDKRAWWNKEHRDVASGVKPGNASCLNFGMKNQADWVDKQEVHSLHEERLNIIKIEVLPRRIDQGIVIDGTGS